MKQFQVRFFKDVTTCDRHTIVVAADTPEEARAKVLAWGNGEGALTDEEMATENLEREGEVVDAQFACLEEDDHPYATTEMEGVLNG